MRKESRFLKMLIFGLLVTVVAARTKKSVPGPLDPKAFAEEVLHMSNSGQLTGFNDMINVMKSPNISEVIEGAIKNGTLGKPVHFYIHNNHKDPLSHEELSTGDLVALKKSGYNSSWPTKIFLHPWLGIPLIPPMMFPYTAIYSYHLTKEHYNLILIDYTKTKGYPIYPAAAVVGLEQAISDGTQFITWLHDESMIDLNQTHIIGLGLGAHIGAGIASNVNKAAQVKIQRVTGLDPAGPLFLPKLPMVNPPHVIGPDDAEYVDTGRTNAIVTGLGMMYVAGKADYYLNGGIMQPGCSELVKLEAAPLTGIALPPGTGVLLATICSHLIAGEFYAWSVLRKDSERGKHCACNSQFKYQLNPLCCDQKSLFGDQSDLRSRGVLYMHYNPIIS